MYKYRIKTYVRGWQKPKQVFCFLIPGIADSSIHQLKNPISPNLKNPNKIKQNPKFHSSNHLSYHLSSKPSKIKHFSRFIIPKSNYHLTKNLPTNPKLSLFISTFADKHFPSKNSQFPHQLTDIGRGLP